MQQRRQRQWQNPASWLLGLGLLLLAASVWVPFQRAERTARVERRADQIAALLLEAGRLADGVWAATTAVIVLARFCGLAQRDGVFVNDLEVLDVTWPDTMMALQNKHYVFQLAISRPEANAIVGAGTVPALEVCAWPRDATGPGHSVFFHPENAPCAFTRNLATGYAGLVDRVIPGNAHRRTAHGAELASSYRGVDEERWICY